MFWDGSTWNGWYKLGGSLIGTPVAVSYKGQLAVFATGSDHAVWWEMFDGAKWPGWSSLGGYTPSGPGATSYIPVAK